MRQVTSSRLGLGLGFGMVLALGAGCTGQLGAVDETGDGGVEAGEDDALPTPEPCPPSGDCPDGTTCRLGECLPACSEEGPPCPGGYYCDDSSGLCQREAIATCPCEAPEFCSFGACITPPRDADCDPIGFGSTVCTPQEICVDVGDIDTEQTQCWEMPACPADGECPVGNAGSVCNEDLVSTKDRVCLIGYCLELDDCPQDWKCVETGTPLGVCSGGRFGELCAVDGDCLSGNCNIFVPGAPGVCG